MRRRNSQKNSKKRINVADTMIVAIDIATTTNTAVFRSPEKQVHLVMVNPVHTKRVKVFIF